MQQLLAKLKPYMMPIIFGGVILIGVVYYFQSSASRAGAPVVLNEDIDAQVNRGLQIEREMIEELLKLNSIRLDDSLFEADTFRSLTDFSQEIEAQPVGRENPFAPIGTVPGVVSRSAEGRDTVITSEDPGTAQD